MRTSYFAEALKREHGPALHLSWLTATAAAPLLQFNPWIDALHTSFDACRASSYDRIFSLDDEEVVVGAVMSLRAVRITGAIRDASGQLAYTPDSRPWFDMGLLSRFGKARADELKIAHRRSHAEIFSEIFSVDGVQPSFHGDPRLEAWAVQWLGAGGYCIGINGSAGGRWPSKELPAAEMAPLVSQLLALRPGGRTVQVVLVGADRERNKALADALAQLRVRVADTDDSVLRLAAVIRGLDLFIPSDSLAMHLAIAQHVPIVAFFAPTSVAEIEVFGRGEEVWSTAPDYCTYRRQVDNNSSIAARLMRAVAALAA